MMRIKTQGILCQVRFNRNQSVFLNTDMNKIIIKEWMSEMVACIYRGGKFSDKQNIRLPLYNSSEGVVLLTLKENGVLIFKLNKNDVIELMYRVNKKRVFSVLTELGSSEGFKNNFEILKEKVFENSE